MFYRHLYLRISHQNQHRYEQLKKVNEHETRVTAVVFVLGLVGMELTFSTAAGPELQLGSVARTVLITHP